MTSLLALFLALAAGGSGAAPPAPASISITGVPESVAAGSPVTFTVTVRDEAGVPLTGYAGTVRFSASPPDIGVPDEYTFGPRDRGTHRFTFTPREEGTLTIDVADTQVGLYGSRTTTVERSAAVVPALSSAGAPRVAALTRPETVEPPEAAIDPQTAMDSGAVINTVAPPARHLYFVAHQDDDLLFMNPDVEDSIRQGLAVRTVFLTAAASSPGSANPPPWYAREDGVPRAYRAMANVPQQPNDWTCAAQTFLTNKVVRVCTLNAQPLVSVVFMRLPDGGTDPVNQPGLAALWAGGVPSLTSLTRPDDVPATPSSTYTRAELIQVLAALIADFAPDFVGTQDSSQAYGPDHADHIATAQFVMEGDHAHSHSHELRMYRGYNVDVWWTPADPSPEVQNLSPAQYDEKLRVMEIYGGPLPPGSQWEPFCSRRYAFSRLSGGTGVLAVLGGLCMNAGAHPADGDPVVAADCASGPTRWAVTGDGRIAALGTGTRGGNSPRRARDDEPGLAAVAEVGTKEPPQWEPPVPVVSTCLVVAADGVTLRVTGCADAPAQTWSLMSNGQIRGAGATCVTLGSDGVTLQALACQAERYSTDKYKPIASQQWVQQMGAAATWSSGSQFSDGDLGSPAAYAGSFRMGDVNGDGYADACIRLAGGIFCALNTGAGAFAPYSLYSAAFSDPSWLPDAYGSTILLGDVNGDGKADVCGRSAGGIVCATANATGTGFVNAHVWSTGPDFSDSAGWGAAPAYYGSIRLADVNGDGYADVCGRGGPGIVCALNNGAGGFGPAGLWIADFSDARGWGAAPYGTTIQLGDVNGDGKADVCGRGPAGVQCATANVTGTGFTDIHPWSLRSDFSDADGWGAAAGYYRSIRLADFDGDGRADVCGRSANGVVCAFSNGGGFDVAQPVMPRGYTDASGWSATYYGATIQFGDLGNDGRGDICGRGPTGLVCAKAP
jgi:LmbE family N-acetylglucosaminyl deacetylase